MHKNRRITLHQKSGKGIQFNYITSQNTLKIVSGIQNLRVVFPLRGPGSHRGGNPRKMGKNYKFPLPGSTPENGENCPQKGVKLLRKYNFCNFSVNFSPFSGVGAGRGIL